MIGNSVPSRATLKAETVPLPAPACAFETNNRPGVVGRNSLPNGPAACAAKGEPGAREGRYNDDGLGALQGLGGARGKLKASVEPNVFLALVQREVEGSKQYVAGRRNCAYGAASSADPGVASRGDRRCPSLIATERQAARR